MPLPLGKGREIQRGRQGNRQRPHSIRATEEHVLRPLTLCRVREGKLSTAAPREVAAAALCPRNIGGVPFRDDTGS